MHFQHFHHRPSLVKSGVKHRRPSLAVGCLHICAMIEQQLRDRALVRMRGGVQRRRAPR